MDGISVIICCFNSEAKISNTLKHLAVQETKGVPWEVIIVDNASTDNTIEIAINEWKTLGNSTWFNIVNEPRQGLSYARKRGVLTSQFDYILFCDDDNWLRSDYITRSFNILKKHPDVGVLGGHGIPEFEAEPPLWFEQFRKSYATGPQGRKTGYLEKFSVYGAGMVLRKKNLLNLYENGFDSLLSDRKGNDLVSGGDNEICLIYRYFGYKFYYDESLFFIHFIPKERLTENYILKRNSAKGKTEAILSLYRDFVINHKKGFSINRMFWNYQILKRIFYLFIYFLKPGKSLREKAISENLRSSIKFRWSSFCYLKDCEKKLDIFLN